MEIITDFKKQLDAQTAFSHIVLGSSKCFDMSDTPEWRDDGELHVSLTINGVNMSVQNLNEILEDWGDRMDKSIKEKYDFLQSEEAVLEKAKELLSDKLSNAYDVLTDIENSSWKLED